MWIKICGLTTPEAVTAALDMNVEAIGFVFAASTRRVTPEFAALLARSARGRARCVAVTRHATQSEIDQILKEFAPDVLQAEAQDLAALRLPTTLQLMPVVRAMNTAPAVLPPRLLFESAISGAGVVADWDAAAVLAPRCELVLAGGLHSANVGAAIAAVRPFGVDVSSGVEERPGMKSPVAIADFVLAARAAGAHVE